MSDDATSGGSPFSERPEACPLCGENETGLDFHHWVYEPDELGCYLCRDCHESIHTGKGRVTDSTPWKTYCMDNLVSRHIDIRPDEDTVEEIVDRYSIPTGDRYELDLLVEHSLERVADGG